MFKKIRKYLLLIVLVLSSIVTCFTSNIIVNASAIKVEGGYTSVLDDLKTDDTFNIDDYPTKDNDYSLEVINIAESEEKELFVYVYQPNPNYGKYLASSINISPYLHEDINVNNYYLTLCNYDGVFQKYVVNNFKVNNDTTRYYEIISIYRKYDSVVDKSLSDDVSNGIDEVAYKVAKQFTIIEKDGKLTIGATNVEVVEITDMYVGFVRYDAEYTHPFQEGHLDNHFVAFSTEWQIDNLYEADVYYVSQDYIDTMDYYNGVYINEYYNKKSDVAHLDYKQTASYTTSGWFNKRTYTWDLIQSKQEFIDTENREYIYNMGVFDAITRTKITDEGLADLDKMQWVLRFANTEYEDNTFATGWVKSDTIVGEVTILRLKFDNPTGTYNLGVVANKQTSDGIPDNLIEKELRLNDTFKIIMMVLLLILFVVVLSPVLPIVFTILGKIIKIIFKILIWIITLPIKVIKWVFKKRKNT